ncbi:MAG: hypothetical protein IJ011_05820 [Clostridia bacterium]|nr:hypothetical protein [Clostridia bacterium]
MSQLFLKIINMSISASYIVLAVLLLRLLLKKAPRWIRVVLWGIVGIRLVCPFSIESALSLIPSAETVSPDIMMDWTPEIDTGIPIFNQVINPVISSSFAPDSATSANPLQLWIPTFALFWIVGIVGLLIYAFISYVRVWHKIGRAVRFKDNVYQSENVASPFVLGLIKPKIYLPFSISDRDMTYVVAHEKAHICRKDHLWKPLGFLLLTLHWFNPLMWLSYILLCRDIELACDEKVIRALDRDERADYSQALLTCSVNRRMISACPLAFGEVNVKDRVKSVLNYKKPAFWIIVVAIVACVSVSVCFLTNPPKEDDNSGIGTSGDYSAVYDTAVFDVDGDGRAEVCCMSVGPTFGMFTFTFSVREIGSEVNEYKTVIYSQSYNLSFEKCEDGVTRVKGVTQGEPSEIHLFDIGVSEGNIILTENGVSIGEIF